MKYYYSKGNGKFDDSEVFDEKDFGPDYVKIRVKSVIPTMSDVNIFNGDASVKYPFIIGHSAIGVIADSEVEGVPNNGLIFNAKNRVSNNTLKRGAKVILNPFINQDGEELGIDRDGFLRDYVYVPKTNIVSYPGTIDDNGGTLYDIKDNDALLTEKVALALEVFNNPQVDYSVGDYMVVIGGNVLGNLICQIAKYRQIEPILIDSSEERLKLAQRCGIYNTINELKEPIRDRIEEITGGRFADKTVLASANPVTADYAFSLCKDSGSCIIVNEGGVLKRFNTDISIIGKKHLNVYGITNGYDEFLSAVDLINKKVLYTSEFIDKVVDIGEADILLREIKANPERYFLSRIDL